MYFPFNVKVSEEDRKRLCEILGITAGLLNLSNGVIRVNSKEAVELLAQKFNIDNVNWESYENFQNGVRNPSKKTEIEITQDTEREQRMLQISDWTLEERKRFIGKKAKEGTIVRVKLSHEIIHVLITDVSATYLKGYKMILGTGGYDPESGDIILEKNKDVVYQNLTYKAKVIVTTELMADLRRQDFLYGYGGLVVGRICNEELLQQILQRNKVKETAAKPEEKVPEEKIPNIGPITEVPTIHNDEKPEDTPNESEKKTQVDLTIAEDEKNGLLPAFEEYVVSKSSEEVITAMNLEGSILAEAIRICMTSKSFNMKKLLPVLQKNYAEKRMTQTAIKCQMNYELAEWCEKKQFSLSEENVSYLLKLLVKKGV